MSCFDKYRSSRAWDPYIRVRRIAQSPGRVLISEPLARTSVEDLVTDDVLEFEQCKNVTFHDAAPKGLPLKWTECQPVVGRTGPNTIQPRSAMPPHTV